MVAAGHTEAGWDEMVAAVEAGVRHVTHTFNAMPGLGHREPGTAGAALALPRAALRADRRRAPRPCRGDGGAGPGQGAGGRGADQRRRPGRRAPRRRRRPRRPGGAALLRRGPPARRPAGRQRPHPRRRPAALRRRHRLELVRPGPAAAGNAADALGLSPRAASPPAPTPTSSSSATTAPATSPSRSSKAGSSTAVPQAGRQVAWAAVFGARCSGIPRRGRRESGR